MTAFLLLLASCTMATVYATEHQCQQSRPETVTRTVTESYQERFGGSLIVKYRQRTVSEVIHRDVCVCCDGYTGSCLTGCKFNEHRSVDDAGKCYESVTRKV